MLNLYAALSPTIAMLATVWPAAGFRLLADERATPFSHRVTKVAAVGFTAVALVTRATVRELATVLGAVTVRVVVGPSVVVPRPERVSTMRLGTPALRKR